MTTQNFLGDQFCSFTGSELYKLHSGLSLYLDYLRSNGFDALYEDTYKTFIKLGSIIAVL